MRTYTKRLCPNSVYEQEQKPVSFNFDVHARNLAADIYDSCVFDDVSDKAAVLQRLLTPVRRVNQGLRRGRARFKSITLGI